MSICMKKKIYLVITPFFPEPEIWRGSYVLDQVKAIMRNSDFEVIIMKPYSFYRKREYDYIIEDIKVFKFKDYTLPSSIYYNTFSDWLSARSLINRLKSIGIEFDNIAICHAHVNELGKYALTIKSINPNVKTIVQHHGFDVFSESLGILAKYQWHKKYCIAYGRNICNNVDLNVAVSNKTMSYVKKKPKVVLKNEYILYNGVDMTLFYPDAIRNSDKFVIGCIGNFWPLKDQMTLIKAIEKLIAGGKSNILVYFIGTGETLDNCKTYVFEHKLSNYVIFKTEVMHDKLPEFYRTLNLFVLPSYFEAFGCVYSEAYYCGVPFIAVKNQGISEIIEEKEQSKWLIERGDYDQLAQLISEYMDAPCEQKIKYCLDINVLVRKFVEFINHI